MSMQRKARLRKIELLAYDPFPGPRWSLPPASPGPTPLALKMRSRPRTRMPRRILLMPAHEEPPKWMI
jgi:hypothetical protein